MSNPRALQNFLHEYPFYWNDNFYAQDGRVGVYCEIDGVNLYTECNADLYEMAITPGEISKSTLRMVGRSQLRTSVERYGIPQLEIGFYVGGANKREAMYNVNVLAQRFRYGGIFKTEEEDYEYYISRSSYTVEETDVPCFYDVRFICDYVKRLPLTSKTIVVSANGMGMDVENVGTVPTGIDMTIKPVVGVKNFSIMGIKVSEISLNGFIRIDGIRGVVNDNHGFAYSKTDLTTFPKINPGVTNISASHACTIEASWYPTFEV